MDEECGAGLTIASVATVPVVITGLLAWQWQLEGHKLRGILLQHLVLGITSSLLIWTVWWIHFRARRKENGSLPSYPLPIEVIAVFGGRARGAPRGLLERR